MQAFTFFGLPMLAQEAASTKLTVTAISAHQGSSTLECWQMDQPFITSNSVGTSRRADTTLGAASNITYSVFPPGYDLGIHNAPCAQYVPFSLLEGLKLPDYLITTSFLADL